ncbi:MAG: hypothetical protein U0361_21615 [Nitrospiraceae bacterium]
MPVEYFGEGWTEVEQAVRTAIEGLRELGADVREASLRPMRRWLRIM